MHVAPEVGETSKRHMNRIVECASLGSRAAPAQRRYGTQLTLTPFVKLNVLGLQNAAAFRYQTW